MMSRTPIDPHVYVPGLCWIRKQGTDRFCTRQKHEAGNHEHEYTGATWPPQQGETR
jgi:hypothetical protein